MSDQDHDEAIDCWHEIQRETGIEVSFARCILVALDWMLSDIRSAKSALEEPAPPLPPRRFPSHVA